MEKCPLEEQTLFRRRLRNVIPKSLKSDLQIAPPSQSSECELDPDAFKTKPDVKEWVWKTALKISRRPSLTFSPSFLLSPICFSPVIIDAELVSPFGCINQLIATPQYSNTPDISTKSSGESTSSNVFTFDVVDIGTDHVDSSSGPISSSRSLCAIPEERELTDIDIEMASKSSQVFQYRKADIPFAPPKSPSIATATKSKKHQEHKKKPDNSKNDRRNSNSNGKKQSKPNQRTPNNCQNKSEQRKHGTTLVKGFEAKRRGGNSMFLSMVTR